MDGRWKALIRGSGHEGRGAAGSGVVSSFIDVFMADVLRRCRFIVCSTRDVSTSLATGERRSSAKMARDVSYRDLLFGIIWIGDGAMFGAIVYRVIDT